MNAIAIITRIVNVPTNSNMLCRNHCSKHHESFVQNRGGVIRHLLITYYYTINSISQQSDNHRQIGVYIQC